MGTLRERGATGGGAWNEVRAAFIFCGEGGRSPKEEEMAIF